jgi:hypothetical protein
MEESLHETSFRMDQPVAHPLEDTDDTDDSVVVDLSDDGVSEEFHAPRIIELAIPILPYKTQSWFGKEKIEMMCTWKLVVNDKGELCLHWTIADGFDGLLHMPEELMVKTVFGERKKSATGKGYKYEVPISWYTYNPQSSKLKFGASYRLLPMYNITAFMENCIQQCHEVIALLIKQRCTHCPF